MKKGLILENKGICELQQKKDKKMKLIFSVYLLVYLTSLFIKVF